MAYNKKHEIKNLLIRSLLSFKFDPRVTINSLEKAFQGIHNYNNDYDHLWETRKGYELNDKSRLLMEKAIKQCYTNTINNKYFESKTIKELYSAICYYENEYSSNGGWTYRMGIFWCGENDFDLADKLLNTKGV